MHSADEIGALLTELSASNLSDALDAVGVEGALQGLSLLSGSGRLVAGPAYPVQLEPVAAGTPGPAADYIDDAPPGSVIVLANGGRMDCTVWGGLLTVRAGRLGLQATVIDGCFRDAAEIRPTGYPIYARSAFMRSGKGRTRLVSAGQPVTIGGITIRPGDLLCGDADGVLAIPRDRFLDVARTAREIQEKEQRILDDLRSGQRLDEARRQHGYNRGAAGEGKAE